MTPLEIDWPVGVAPKMKSGVDYDPRTRVLHRGSIEVPWASGHIVFRAMEDEVGGEVHIVTRDAKSAMVVDVNGVPVTYSGPEVVADFRLKINGDKLIVGGCIYVRALAKEKNHGTLDEIGRRIG